MLLRSKGLPFAFVAIGVPLPAALGQTQSGNSPPAKTSGQSNEGTSQPPAFDASTTEFLKARLHASDEEWKLIEPKLRKAISAKQATETGIKSGLSANSGTPGDFGGGRGLIGSLGFGNDNQTSREQFTVLSWPLMPLDLAWIVRELLGSRVSAYGGAPNRRGSALWRQWSLPVRPGEEEAG